ncbi:MAG: hypothetical protein ABSH25_18890, partial [Syntrophorhabdales bacterium]
MKRGLAAAAHSPVVAPPVAGYSVLRSTMGAAGHENSGSHRRSILATSERVNRFALSQKALPVPSPGAT